jgi:CarD family transcriptional regulator
MFKVGDKVVYPMHGAGVIEAIEEREVFGQTKRYFVLQLPVPEMQVMVPCDNLEQTGLRRVVNESVLSKVLEVLQARKSVMVKNWNLRYRANLEKIRSGNVLELAEVVRNLSHWHRERGLSGGERKMLENARQILVSEIILARDLDLHEANNLLDQALAQ